MSNSLFKSYAVAEEFNKYLSYVRNLGFEDTPDYDYLRDLFTQALKNAGEVEDGEYDWMKLNNGRGWEAMKHYSPNHLHAANQAPITPSAKPILGADTQRGPGTPSRLNSQPPLPQSPAKPGVTKTHNRPGGSGGGLSKLQNGPAGGLTANGPTPTPSTRAQFQNSDSRLPPNRFGTPNPGLGQAANGGQNGRGIGVAEEHPTAVQKFMKALCCGGR